MCAEQRKSDSLQGFKVLGISAGSDSTNAQTMTIDLIINLWNQKIKNNNFFTIGAASVANIDLQPNSPYFLYRNKFTGNSKNMFSFLNMENNYIYALAIIYKKGHTFPELVLNQKKPFSSIDNNLQEIIRENRKVIIRQLQTVPNLTSRLCRQTIHFEKIRQQQVFKTEHLTVVPSIERHSYQKNLN